MHDIKFRAWDKENKKMREVIEVRLESSFGWIDEYGDYCEEIDFSLLMQYTGLKDKNGKEIYEGDIVYASGYTDWDGYANVSELYGVVKFEDFSWCVVIGECITPLFQECFYRKNIKDIKVKGNIYENPELINLTIEN